MWGLMMDSQSGKWRLESEMVGLLAFLLVTERVPRWAEMLGQMIQVSTLVLRMVR